MQVAQPFGCDECVCRVNGFPGSCFRANYGTGSDFASEGEGTATTTVEKGHGRIEQRRLRASTGLNEYLDWPRVRQVFRVDRRTEHVKRDEITHETAHGITSLGPEQADPQQLLAMVRGHWNIENGYITDATRPCVKTGVICGWDTLNT